MRLFPSVEILLQAASRDPFYLKIISESLQEIIENVVVKTLCSVTKSCPNLCSSTDGSSLGSSVLHWLLEFVQINVH